MEENMQIVAVDSAASKKDVEAQYVEMMVPLYSYGCERKVKKTLSHLKGIYSVNVDYKQQKVTVWGICNKYDVLSTMKTKRKEARFWNHEEDNINININNNININDNIKMQNSKPSFYIFRSSSSLSFKAWRKVFARSLSF